MRYGLAAALFMLAYFGLRAQEVTAGIYGTVQDSSGAVIPNALVTLHNVDTGRNFQATSDGSGNFSITLVPIGNYEAGAEAAGFKKGAVTGVRLRVNDNRRIDFKLEVGQVTEAITVSADIVTVNTASGTTSAVISGVEMMNLPASGRNVAPFALLMPGAVSTTPTSKVNNYTSVNGIRPTHNAWLMDGGYDIDTGGNWNITLAPNMEIVDEFRAIRGNYSAEFGIGGGSQFNIITRSGTNQLHGSAYEYLRNSDLNARSYFQPTLPVSKINEFGFTAGGPAYIPKFYNGRNKTFFFVNGDWTEQRSESLFLQKLPELPYRAGDFSALGKTITDPLNNGAPFPGNLIPASRMDPNGVAYAKQYPATNFRDTLGNNWTKVQPGRNNNYQYTLRGDHNFNEKHRLSARLTKDYTDNDFGAAAGFDFLREDDISIANNTVVGLTSTLRPSLINDFNFTRVHNRLERFPLSISPAASGINITPYFPVTEKTYPLQSLNLSAIPQRVPNIGLTNYASIAPSTPWSNFQSIFDFKDNLTWIKGIHTIKTGFDFAYEKKFEPTNTDVFGTFTFDGKQTNDAFADLLLGRAAQYSDSNTVAFNDNRRRAFEAYVDDSWKVKPRLVLNLGLRYSLFPPAYEETDRYRIFSPAAYDPKQAVTVNAAGQVVRGSGNPLNGIVNPKHLWEYSRHNFAPRFSFAYDVKGDGKTAIRGGFGMFYSREILGAFILMSGNPPFQTSTTIFNTTLSNPAGGNTADFDAVTTIGSNDLHQLTPYTEQWNFNIQRALTSNLMLEVGYAGSHGIHFMRTQDPNQPLPNVGIANKTLNPNTLRPYPGYGIISHREQSYASKYHGLQVELSRRFTHGLMFKADYTWSKALDTTDCCSGNIYNWYPNTRNASTEWGRSSFDGEHNFIANYIWDIPFLLHRRDIAGRVLGGWQFSGIVTFMSGLPFDPTLGIDQAGIGSTARQRPQVVGNPFLGFGDRTVGQWFVPTAFAPPAIGTYASTSRNFLSLPGTNNWDVSMVKSFSLSERMQFRFRADAFNPFNHTQFNGVGSSYAVPSSFSKVTSAKNARNLMLGLRLEF